MSITPEIINTLIGIAFTALIGLQAWILLAIVSLRTDQAIMQQRLNDIPCLNGGGRCDEIQAQPSARVKNIKVKFLKMLLTFSAAAFFGLVFALMIFMGIL